VKSVLCINNVVFAGDKNKTVSKIAVCTGSGGSLVQDCISNNVEVFLTGELKYSEAQLAVQNGINIISTGHYESEIIFIPFIVDYLTKYFTGVNFFINASKANNSILRTM
jgi:putative NIF3 family GTP cyclohydrolase 1 type 2